MGSVAHAVSLQFAAGKVFFAGLLLAAACGALLQRRQGRLCRAALTVGAAVGGVLVLLSATPQPAWLQGPWFACLGLALLAGERSWPRRIGWRGLAAGSALLAGLELPYHVASPIPFPPDRPVIVIGDSLAMALEDGVVPWPAQWGAQSGLAVSSLAAGGKRTETAAQDARPVAASSASVLIEIGGNDLLGGTSGQDFERSLTALLETVCTPGRSVAMFELPLPPFRQAYGRSQRRLARKHGVTLIPKRTLADILADPRATVDGIHLSGIGHTRLAARLGNLLD